MRIRILCLVLSFNQCLVSSNRGSDASDGLIFGFSGDNIIAAQDTQVDIQPSLIRSRARIIIPDDTLDHVDEENQDDLTWKDSLSYITLREPLSLALSPPRLLQSLDSGSPPNNIIAALPSLGRTKTGTTIVGIYIDRLNDEGAAADETGSMIVLAADTRATAGRLVADKRADKIHALTPPNTSVAAFACGAGTSADLDKITRQCYYTMQLKELEHSSIGQGASGLGGANNPVASPIIFEALCQFLQDSLYEQGGQCGANLIVGGAANGKCHLRAIHPHGSMDRLETFSALGSGGLAAMAVLENNYRRNMTREEAIALAKQAIMAGIDNDLGSGSQVDLCIIYSSGRVEQMRAAVQEQELDALALASDEKRPGNDRVGGRGVNGFGSVPFVIKSRREIKLDPDAREEEWNRILGL